MTKSNTFYTIAIAVMREHKFCKYKPVRHCAVIQSDEECVKCVEEKIKLAKVVK